MASMRLTTITVALLYLLYSSVAAAQEDFTVWLNELKQEAIAAGISEATATASINHIEFMPNVIKLDLAQPEFISPFLEYYSKRVDALKIARGRELLVSYEPLLNKIEAQYGVPKSLLIAFWGMETSYGSYQGDVDTLSTLATLAYDSRRAGFFRGQLLDAMRMIDAGHATVDQLHGSWAGAFGHMQFMPTTFITYAVDGDGDQQIDVVHSVADALASAANYLSQVGWRKDEPAMLEVQLPENFAWQNAQLILKKPIDDWACSGVSVIKSDIQSDRTIDSAKTVQAPILIQKTATGTRKSNRLNKAVYKKPVSKQIAGIALQNSPSVTGNASPTAEFPHVAGQAAIILPQGWRGPAFMVFDNFDVIMDWNRSVNYALSVAQLAKRINGESRILGGQYAEAGALSFQQTFELQAALNALGFDAGEPDGFPGLQTQAAIRAYQLSQGLPADGYASPILFNRLINIQPSDSVME